VGIAAYRPAKKDSETYEITGLDIGCKRAMFQNFEMICLALLSLALRVRCIANQQFAQRS
jgi:hypothetical protein